MRKPIVLVAMGVVAILAMGADDSCTVEDNPKPATQAKVNGGKQKSHAEPAKPTMTPGQKNALQSAHDYLDYSAFSKDGLISQLSSSAGDGFSKADATFAANHVGANWKEQAYRAAKDYLEYSSFSLSGLIDQLSSAAGEKFTPEQAEYGATKAYNGK